jgi:hypothetical protein
MVGVLRLNMLDPLSAQHQPDGAQGRIRRRSAEEWVAFEYKQAAAKREAPASVLLSLQIGQFTAATNTSEERTGYL